MAPAARIQLASKQSSGLCRCFGCLLPCRAGRNDSLFHAGNAAVTGSKKGAAQAATAAEISQKHGEGVASPNRAGGPRTIDQGLRHLR